jgi:peroxiredoxin
LADFEEHQDAIGDLDAALYALSAESEEEANTTVSKLGLSYPVGFGLDIDEVAEKTGAYRDEEGGYLQATSFILRDGQVMHATYSSGPLGRLSAENAAAFIEHSQSG